MSACDNLRADHRELVPQVQAVVGRIRRLTAIHFEKEEQIFYPSLCPALRDLVAQ